MNRIGLILRLNLMIGLWLMPAVAALASAFDGTQYQGALNGGSAGATTTINRVTSLDTSLGGMFLSIAQVLGIVFGIKGVMMMVKGEQMGGQGGFAKGGGMLLAGIGLYFLPAIIGMGGRTLFPTLG